MVRNNENKFGHNTLMITRKIYFVLLILLVPLLGVGQARITSIQQQLEALAMETPAFNEPVEFSVNGATIQEVVRGIGLSHNLNLSVDPNINERVTNNFADAKVIDVLVYLCKEFSLDISITGSIVNLKKFSLIPEPPKPVPPKVLAIDFQQEGALLSLDLKNDTLSAVAKEITRKSGINLIVSPEAGNKVVNLFVQQVPFESAADKLGYAAGLTLTKTPDGIYVLEKPETTAGAEKNLSFNSRNKNQSAKVKGLRTIGNVQLDIKENGLLSVDAHSVGIAELLETVSKEMGINYLLYSTPKGESSLFLENISYQDFLGHVLTGSNLTYKLQDSIYLIGDRNYESLRHTELVRLENRTIQLVKEAIPAELKKEVELFEFKELNGFVLSGSKPKINELKAFIRQIDQVVPLITIDVMIVDVSNSRTTQTGLTFGLGGTAMPTATKGNTDGGLNVSLTSKSINQLLSAFNGFGSVNVGKVTQNFYMSLKALESEGIVKTRSTPRLSTLNGNEATLSIGRTEYYLELQNNIIGSQNPTVSASQNYKSVNADLTVTINPVVSGDEQVTLSIEVNQSDFTGRISETAPPGSVTRKFKSIIRVKNEEMVILGGLENNRTEKTGSGLPFINRIPVIKYLFGSRMAKKDKSKLAIFIKPTIHY